MGEVLAFADAVSNGMEIAAYTRGRAAEVVQAADCNHCRTAMISPNPATKTSEPPPKDAAQESPLVEGVDYYLEAGRWVFTADYHKRRGHCCKSGCRHCPYGFSVERATDK